MIECGYLFGCPSNLFLPNAIVAVDDFGAAAVAGKDTVTAVALSLFHHLLFEHPNNFLSSQSPL